MIYPNFTKDEQKAILHIASAVAFNGDWHENAKRLLNAIGHRFSFTLQEIGDSITLERQKALSSIKGLDSEKKGWQQSSSCLQPWLMAI